ncbi:MAG: 4-(cytidine 5'-diphospho)-2-C-methyl-D-erythritol kinase [Microbacterium sp.]
MTFALEDPQVRVAAPATLTLFLEVGRASQAPSEPAPFALAVQAISLADEVAASDSDEFTIDVAGLVDVDRVPADDRNLAIRAARMLAADTGYEYGVHLDLFKRIPVGSGMAGSVADAAAALVACDALWQTGLTSAELSRIGARLSPHIPFALRGGTAVGTALGEQMSPALARDRIDWVLVIDDDAVPLPDVLQALNDHRERHRLDIVPARSAPGVDSVVLQALRTGDAVLLAEVMRNDLQAAVLGLRPDLAEILETGEASGALTGMVTASGTTLAFLAPSSDAAAELQLRLDQAGYDAVRAHGPVPGARTAM